MDLTLTQEQKDAVDRVMTWIDEAQLDAFALSGAAGTGKTTLLRVLKDRFVDAGLHVLYTAMTGKAAQRMYAAAGVDAKTFHSAFYWPPGQVGKSLVWTRIREPECDVVVIDEASMVTPTIWQELKHHWCEKGVTVFFVGDGYQLPPVMSRDEEKKFGTDFTIFASVPTVQLSTVMRTTGDVLHVATKLRTEGQLVRENVGTSYQFARGPIYNYAVGTYVKHPTVGLITWRNEVRMKANDLIRTQKKLRGDARPTSGEPVLVCKNGHGYMNGEVLEVSSFTPIGHAGPVDLWRLEPVVGIPLTVTINDGRTSHMFGDAPYLDPDAFRAYKTELRRMNLMDPVPITWGYVLTAHKAQGSEFDNVLVFLSEYDVNNRAMMRPSKLPDGSSVPFWRRWMYTALTRAKETCAVVIGTEEVR